MPRMQPTVKGATVVRAPAKLTTELRIVGVRADGYHLIDAEMIDLDLADVVELTTISPEQAAPDETVGFTVSGPFADGVPADSTNLVARALRLAGRSASVHIDKQIPHGGGLGGGSSDVAAVLRWAGFTDLIAASRLGADIPFCMVGGRARVTGIGEFVAALPTRPAVYTIVVPPFGVSTPAVYRAWDDMGGPSGDNGNDLEPAAVVVEPLLATWKLAIAHHAGVEPRLAGSGATWFLDGAFDRLAEQLPDAYVRVVNALQS